MKRLVLMGGRPWQAADGGKRQVEVILRYFSSSANIALCIFAQDERDWAETLARNQAMIDHFKGRRTLTYKIMTQANFAELSAWADIIYMPGGDPLKLKQALETCGDLSKKWDNKLIAGSSAGMDVLCAHFSYLQQKTVLDGFGWIKASCIPHWRNNGEDEAAQTWAEAELLRRHSDLPILSVAEGDFVEVSVA